MNTASSATDAINKRRLMFDAVNTEDIEADDNIRRLGDFIKNRAPPTTDAVKVPESDPKMHEECDGEPIDCRFGFIRNENSYFVFCFADLPNTEMPEIVGWGDPEQRGANNGMRHRGVPYFSISLANETDKVRIIEQIRKLGGRICDNLHGYDLQCTHLVCDRPNRGEKICCCIASGKWVLNIEYVQKSTEVGRFLDVSTCCCLSRPKTLTEFHSESLCTGGIIRMGQSEGRKQFAATGRTRATVCQCRTSFAFAR